MGNQTSFGDWLQSELDERHLTISECARRLGVTQGAVSHWILSGTKPRCRIYRDVSRRFSICRSIALWRCQVDVMLNRTMSSRLQCFEDGSRVPNSEYQRVVEQAKRGELFVSFNKGLNFGIELGKKMATENMWRTLLLLDRIPMDDETAKHVRPWLDSLE